MTQQLPMASEQLLDGILVVAEESRRISWPERELIRQIGSKLYGRRSGEDR